MIYPRNHKESLVFFDYPRKHAGRPRVRVLPFGVFAGSQKSDMIADI